MALGYNPPEDFSGTRKSDDPINPEILRVAEEIKVRARGVANKGFTRDQLVWSDSRRERLKVEIDAEVAHFSRELRNLHDYMDELTPKAKKAIKQVEKDIDIIGRYGDEEWAGDPFGAFLDNVDVLYDRLVNP